ncbi:hypothetical protein PG997_013996 [Apiospora hydei]|uniref:Uncharacterized protein n=1 Tax=Apiospora hydei TaxID=1337664 RepID=A0ABR1VB41_9PEZI
MLSNTILALFAGTAAAAAVSSSSSAADACSTQTVCADYVNACGQMYGGCFSACTPWPTFTPPPCTPNTISTSTTGTITSAPPRRLCADHVRTCGTTAVLTFGGCYPACSPSPLYTAPPCPTGAPGPGITPRPPPASRATAAPRARICCGRAAPRPS